MLEKTPPIPPFISMGFLGLEIQLDVIKIGFLGIILHNTVT